MSRRCFLVPVFVLLASCTANRTPGDGQAVTPPSSAKLAQPGVEFTIGEPLAYQNLTVFPVLSKEPRDVDRFMTLDEGLKSGLVEIRELGAPAGEMTSVGTAAPTQRDHQEAANPSASQADESGPSVGIPPERANSSDPFAASDPFGVQDPFAAVNEVNRVLVVNRSDRPLYLMPGEIVVGGDQDRSIGQELVIQPGPEPVPVEVFCVEHGRWGGRGAGGIELLADSQEFPTNLSLVISQTQSVSEIAAEAERGKFVASAGSLNKSARMAVHDTKNQTDVWDRVAEANAKANVESASGAFTGQYIDEEAVRRLEPYVNALHDPIDQTERVVGVVVAVNNKIEMMDVFESTPLFRKLWPKLLKSYAIDAANALPEDDAEGAGKACSREAAREFLAEAIQAQVEESAEERGIALTKHASDRVVTYSAGEADAAVGVGLGGFGGGGFHTSGFAR